MSDFVIRSYQEGLDAVGTLGRAIEHIREEFRDDLNRDEAQSNMDARALLVRRNNALLDEMELQYVYGGKQEVI